MPELAKLRSVLRTQFTRDDKVALSQPTQGQPRPLNMPNYVNDSAEREGDVEARGSKPKSRTKQWHRSLLSTVFSLTILIAAPALMWYAAVPLTSMTDITGIFNCFAIWAYLLAVRFLGEKKSKIKFGAVGVAVAGVGVIAWGDSKTGQGDGKGRLIGNLLALVGSGAYA